jgi:hypothetical protein
VRSNSLIHKASTARRHGSKKYKRGRRYQAYIQFNHFDIFDFGKSGAKAGLSYIARFSSNGSDIPSLGIPSGWSWLSTVCQWLVSADLLLMWNL